MAIPQKIYGNPVGFPDVGIELDFGELSPPLAPTYVYEDTDGKLKLGATVASVGTNYWQRVTSGSTFLRPLTATDIVEITNGTAWARLYATGLVQPNVATAGDAALLISTDADGDAARFEILGSGTLNWYAPSGGSLDTSLSRGAANRLDLASGDALRIIGGSGDFGSPANGMLWYDSASGKLRGYEGGAWGDLISTGGGITSPLTTKGDVWGFSTVDARIPIGTDGQVLTADSTQALGLRWATGSSYTDEQAQDAVGTILVDTATIDFTYTDATPSITADVKDDSITYAKIQNVSATDKLLGRATAGAGDVEEITCTAFGRSLIDDAAASNARATLGLGDLAVENGPLAVAKGGTGSTSFTANNILYSDGTVITSNAGFKLFPASDTLKLAPMSGGNTPILQFAGATSGNAYITAQAAAGGGTFTLPKVDRTGVAAQPGSTLPLTISSAGVEIIAALTVAQGGSGAVSFSAGSVLMMGATAFVEDNTNFVFNQTANANYLKIGAGTAPGEIRLLEGSGTGVNTVNIVGVQNLAATIDWTAPSKATTEVTAQATATAKYLTADTSGVRSYVQPAITDLAAFTSANLASVVSDEEGSGKLVFNTSPTFVTPVLGAATGTSLTTTGLIKSSGATAGIGYATGAGGAVTQGSGSGKATGVTLNNVCGQITTDGAALAANTSVSFTWTNSAIAATDTVEVNLASGHTTKTYNVWIDGIAAGSCVITLRNISLGSKSESIVLNVGVNKRVAA